MKKVLVVCSGGLGTSLVLKLQVKQHFQEWELDDVIVEQSDVSAASFMKADLIIGAKQVVQHLQVKETEILGLSFIADRALVKESLEGTDTVKRWRERV